MMRWKKSFTADHKITFTKEQKFVIMTFFKLIFCWLAKVFMAQQKLV